MNFYFAAAKVLDRLDAKQGSVQSNIRTLPDKDRKRTAALVIETLKYKSALADVISTVNLLKEERKVTSQNLALVLVHDLLLSNGIQAGDGPVKQAVLRHKTRLHSEFQRIKIKRGVKSNAEIANTGDGRAAQIPRYVRVNTLKWSLEEATEYFERKGYQQGSPLIAKNFKKDQHIPGLLLFPPQTQFGDDPAYTSGKIILQDKASCFPATVLAPPAKEDSVVIDATAAPGNKTSHLSALMGNKGKLLAFERDRRRFKILQSMLQKAGCKNVETINGDFLVTDPRDPKFAGVTHILLDPSCSGSGIVNRLDYLVESEQDKTDNLEDRLNKLAVFQLMMVRHAMRFPSVEKIVYSTCSIHATENEQVVLQALTCNEAFEGGFELASREHVLSSWHRRGLPGILKNSADADALVRCSPGEDATNGFFVSCFQRGQPLEASTPSPRKIIGASGHGASSKRKEIEGDGASVSLILKEGAPKRKRKKNTHQKSVDIASS
ncbi:S-adenosyl-L-methionine-dependent methyltransferase [Artomyces pyxidatus]|uniref:S-adenosyl-L-methionine-dependent methyltransferase n=1 Tax=Artomyces pyxidatus TaxID=48021 RepID=A0ACB8TG03_9AGAM|nr:S-adenosyl-L-methionine-dependent methyltransferase [Artomyces pyxidatus]